MGEWIGALSGREPLTMEVTVGTPRRRNKSWLDGNGRWIPGRDEGSWEIWRAAGGHPRDAWEEEVRRVERRNIDE